MRLHPEGYRSVGVTFTLALLIFVVSYSVTLPFWADGAAWFLMIASLALLGFYRDPDRSSVTDALSLVSAADGKVIQIIQHDYCPELDGPGQQISVFMSPLNVHVNRAAIAGTVRRVEYRPGEYLVAYHEKASEKNEACLITIEDDKGRLVALRQIAGFVARRIRWQVQEGDHLERSQRYGIIKLGSRVDHFVPPELDVRVTIGEHVKAGKSVLGVWT